MSFYVRVFSQAEDFPSLNALCDCLLEEGYEFSTSPGIGEEEFTVGDWREIVFRYDKTGETLELERNIASDDIFEDEKEEFLELIKELPYSKEQKKAKEIIKNSVQIYAFELSEDLTEEGWDFLECILDFICDATDGYVQVDEEGIYDNEGNILVEIE